MPGRMRKKRPPGRLPSGRCSCLLVAVGMLGWPCVRKAIQLIRIQKYSDRCLVGCWFAEYFLSHGTWTCPYWIYKDRATRKRKLESDLTPYSLLVFIWSICACYTLLLPMCGPQECTCIWLIGELQCPLRYHSNFFIFDGRFLFLFSLPLSDRLFSKNGRMPGGAGRRTSTSFEATNASSATGIPNLVR